jgi:glycosyltransferase involved in cell wall biosynthesis
MATRLVLAGRVDNESYVRDLMNVAEQEGVAESLELIGPLDALGLREWYRRAAVLAFPTTHHEGLPRILLESQAMQVPPVAYAIGGVREGLVDGVSGYAVGVGDLPALVARVHELLANRDRRRTMAEAGRQFVLRSFTLDGLAARHEQLYASVLR